MKLSIEDSVVHSPSANNIPQASIDKHLQPLIHTTSHWRIAVENSDLRALTNLIVFLLKLAKASLAFLFRAFLSILMQQSDAISKLLKVFDILHCLPSYRKVGSI